MTTTQPRPTPAARVTAKETGYGRTISLVLLSAFTLSVVHTVYAAVMDLEDPDFTVTTPLTWLFYAVAFTVTALCRSEARWVQRTVVGYLVVVLAIGIFYYPTTFTEEKQTTFGWFENDVYLGLLTTALFLSVLRLRGRTLVPHG